MRTFAQKPKAVQQTASHKSTIPGRAHFGQSRAVRSLLHLQRTIGNQAVQQLLKANTGNGKGDSSTAGIARFGHDFSRIPVHSNPPISSLTRQRVASENHIGERVHAFGVISARTSLCPHEGSPAMLRREADIYAQGKTPVRVGGQLAAWDAKPLGALETGTQLREIQRQFGPEGVERSVRGLAHTRGEGFAHSAAEHAGFSPAARLSEGSAIGQEAAGAIRASSASGPLPDDVREKLTSASGHDFDGTAIHNDAGAHRAADLL